ncbi:MAG: redoxin domain-containing protein [Thermogemmatispora sp.]|uniref:redoxin domain-containing protein n=1 Tax=Thermogemmatispora sp. TaxID=1968838 RepID=UPI00262E4425|nr:redoxin domain-containing protein [Thermogemmatispora sp.]MBX5457602.1 redoxin domain-containing protein [Thermogemmatispora sp.]
MDESLSSCASCAQPALAAQAKLGAREMLPSFALPDPAGVLRGPHDYKQRNHLLLLIVRSVELPSTRIFLQQFAEAEPVLREEQCSLLAISPDHLVRNAEAQASLRLPFPLLADPTGEVIARLTQWEATQRALNPSLLLADRYGELYQQWVSADEQALPPLSELLSCLRYLNRLCCP